MKVYLIKFTNTDGDSVIYESKTSKEETLKDIEKINKFTSITADLVGEETEWADD